MKADIAAHLKELLELEDDEIKEFYDAFIKEFDKSCVDLQEPGVDSDFQKLRIITHTMFGYCENMGAMDIFALAKELNAAAKAEELRASIPGSVMLGQFRNPANPLSHYETTGPEIYRDLEGKIDCFVAGAGSGGTYTGVVKYLKEQNPNIWGVLADPLGSTIGGGEHADYDIEGIGNDFIPETMDISLVDQVIKVSDTEAFAQVKELAAKEGLIVGTSSGAAVAAARKLIEDGARGNIVTLLPDRGERYFSKHLYD